MTSWAISGVLGFLLGIVAGYKKDTWIDKAIKVYCYILQSAPTFWIGINYINGIQYSAWMVPFRTWSSNWKFKPGRNYMGMVKPIYFTGIYIKYLRCSSNCHCIPEIS